MRFYWLYDLPSWLFATLVILFFLAFGLVGLFTTRGIVRRIHEVDHSHNDIVGYFLAALTVFYGITLGLVAVGTWSTFSAVNDKVDAEAQLVASLYRDTRAYPDPAGAALRHDLTGYVVDVVTVSWPLQRQGQVPYASGAYLDAFQSHLFAVQSAGTNAAVVQAEAFKQFNALVEMRRARLNAVESGLPGPIWTLVIIGGLLCVATTWFFHTRSLRMHAWMVGLMAGLLGLIVFMIAILDNPFRGRVSVSSAPLELVYRQLMAPGARPTPPAG